jgi:hypothetical protein
MKTMAIALLFATGCATGTEPTGWTYPTRGAGQTDPGSGDNGGDDAASGGGVDAGVAKDSGKPSQCQDPPGPYGIHQGETIDPNLSWPGSPENTSTLSTVQMRDLFDCDGSKGINAIIIDTSAFWCGTCQNEAHDLPGVMQGQWGPAGVHVLTLVWQTGSNTPATPQDAMTWKQQFGLTMVNVAADPNFTFADRGAPVGLPRNMLVDPRTLQICAMQDGYGGADPVVLQFAQSRQQGSKGCH